jgi:hypothetical protein
MKIYFLLFLCFLSALSTELFAQDSIVTKSSKLDFLDDIDQRNWRVKVPLWVPGFRGDFAYGGITQLPEEGDINIIGKLQGDIGVQFYVIGDIEYKPNQWFFNIDGVHTSLSSNLKFQNIDRVEFQTGIDGTILRGFAGYNAFERQNKERHFRIQIYPYIGARYIDLKIYSKELDILDLNPSWFEPIVGVEIPIQFKRWFFSSQLDVGGFSINNHWSWDASLSATYRFTRLFALGAGWNFLNFNYDQNFELKHLNLEIQLSGPVLGVEFHF